MANNQPDAGFRNANYPTESYDLSCQLSAISNYQNRSSTSDTKMESLVQRASIYIGSVELNTQDEETEVEQRPQTNLTASSPDEKMYEIIIQDYKDECDYLISELKKAEALKRGEGSGTTSLEEVSRFW